MLTIYLSYMFTMASSLDVHAYTNGQNLLQNKHLKVAAEPWSPFWIFYCDGKEMDRAYRSLYNTYECPDKGNRSYGGLLWELLDLVRLQRNVTFSFLRPRFGAWGLCHGVKNCTGMIGMVNRREVDFSIGMFINNLTVMKCVFLESKRK